MDSKEIDQEIEKALASYTPPPAVIEAQRTALARGVMLLLVAFVTGFGAGAGVLWLALGGA